MFLSDAAGGVEGAEMTNARVLHFLPATATLRLLGSGGAMKFGVRRPSLRRSIAARTSPKRFIRNALGLKAPRGYGWITNPRRAAYNRVYNRTTVSAWSIFGALLRGIFRSR